MVKANSLFLGNFLGVRELQISPGVVTMIEGPNGMGKSSILEGFRTHAVGGNDATLLSNGAERGESVLVLSDGLQLRKDLKSNGETPRSVIQNGSPMKRPVGILDKLFDSLSVDPSAFMSPGLKPPERNKIVLGLMPLEVSAEQIAQATGADQAAVEEILAEARGYHALELI